MYDDNKQQQLDDLYWELGKAYYEGGYEDPLPELLPLFDQITQLMKGEEALFSRPEAIDDYEMDSLGERIEAQVNEIAEPRFCAACGHKLRPSAMFCSGCGQPLG